MKKSTLITIKRKKKIRTGRIFCQKSLADLLRPRGGPRSPTRTSVTSITTERARNAGTALARWRRWQRWWRWWIDRAAFQPHRRRAVGDYTYRRDSLGSTLDSALPNIGRELGDKGNRRQWRRRFGRGHAILRPGKKVFFFLFAETFPRSEYLNE